MSLILKNEIETTIQIKRPDGSYDLNIRWGTRMAQLTVYRRLSTELTLSELTLEDIEKMSYDLMKIIEEERKCQ